MYYNLFTVLLMHVTNGSKCVICPVGSVAWVQTLFCLLKALDSNYGRQKVGFQQSGEQLSVLFKRE